MAKLVLLDNTVSVYCALMTSYQAVLSAYLAKPENDESALAALVGKSQAAINRYRNGRRFPDAQTARLIDQSTNGEVPFSAWQDEFFARSGIAA